MDLDDLLGIDPRDPLQRRARRMTESDHQLIVELKRIREHKKLTQQDVADRMQISQSAVARIEAGERDPRLSTLRRYAMAIGALIDHDVEDDERPRPVSPGGQHRDMAWPETNGIVVRSKKPVEAR